MDPDVQLLQRAGQGDRHAFAVFMNRQAPAVLRLTRRLTAHPTAAEDALQETFTAAWRSASTYEGAASPRNWLFAIARRQAARTWRRRAGEPRFSESLDTLGPLAGWGDNPEQAAQRSEDRAHLLAALTQLPESDQELLMRCDLEEGDRGEIAATLGLQPGTLRVRLHRARLRLMAALRQDEVSHG